MADETKIVEQPHSVKISINAKGKFSGEVKTYGLTPDAALKQTTEIAKQLETLIAEKNNERLMTTQQV